MLLTGDKTLADGVTGRDADGEMVYLTEKTEIRRKRPSGTAERADADSRFDSAVKELRKPWQERQELTDICYEMWQMVSRPDALSVVVGECFTSDYGRAISG